MGLGFVVIYIWLQKTWEKNPRSKINENCVNMFDYQSITAKMATNSNFLLVSCLLKLCKATCCTIHCGSSYTQGILTNNRYMQHEFKLKFSTLSKAYDIKFTENSKNISLLMIVDNNHFNFWLSSMARSLPVENLLPQIVGSIITCSNLLKQPNRELLVTVDHNHLRIIASETVN